MRVATLLGDPELIKYTVEYIWYRYRRVASHNARLVVGGDFCDRTHINMRGDPPINPATASPLDQYETPCCQRNVISIIQMFICLDIKCRDLNCQSKKRRLKRL